MEETWDGMERRERVRRRGEDRRVSPEGQCPLHELIWEKHDQDRKENRDLISEELRQLRLGQNAMTPWKVFALSMLIVLGAIGWLGHRFDEGQVKVTSEIQLSLNKLSQEIIGIHNKIAELHSQDQIGK